MRKNLRSPLGRRGGLIGLLTVIVLALVPAAPAAAIQTISWTTSPPATAVVGQTVSFAASGTANTFLGARITGCFVNFPDGNNYTNAYGGNFTTGSCSYTNRTMTTPGTYPITIGFTLSTGSTMALSWNINVQAPTPTVVVPSSVTAEATSVQGAVATFEAHGTDSYYGTSSATCSPASGSVFPVGSTTVSCQSTNPGGKTGTGSFNVNVTKTDPTLVWTPPASATYGTTYGDLATAAMQASDATGTITYTRADGTEPAATDRVPVGSDQVITATYVPSSTASVAYRQVAVQRTVSVTRAASSVAFDSGTPTSKQFGSAPFTVHATGTPGAGIVTISAQAGSTCVVSSPSTGDTAAATVAITGAGSCVLRADQAATSNYAAASTAQWSVTTSKANPEISWNPPATLTYGDPVSSVYDATADTPGTMTYLVDGVEVGPETLLDAGDARVVSVTFTPDNAADYTEATDTRTFTVSPAAQTVTVGQIDDQTFGSAPFDLDIGGTGPGTVSATATGACTVDDLEVTLTSAGDCTVAVDKAATSNYAAATTVNRTFTVNPGAQTLTVASIDDKTYGSEPFNLDIGGTGPGTVSASATGACSAEGVQVSLTSAGECTVTVDKAAATNYAAATSVTRTFTVDPAAQTLTVGSIGDKTYGDEPFNLITGGTGPGTVSASATGACSVGDLEVTLTKAGDCTVTVDKAAATDYAAATSVTRTFAVDSAAQTLTVGAIGDKTFGDGPFTLDIGGTGPGTVSASATGACSAEGVQVSLTSAGDCTLTVSKAAAANYLAAPSVTRTFAVSPSAPTISGVSPASGPTKGGTSVRITGTGFTGATSVKFGTTAATFRVTSSTTIVATSPAKSAGTYDIRITTADKTSAIIAADRFTVRPVPKVTKLSATSGSKAGGKSVTITGTGFTGTTKVTFGTVSATFTVSGSTKILVKTPRLARGTYDVRVATSGGTSSKVKADRYTAK